MKWTAGNKPEVAIHTYTPQIIVTNDSNANLLLGYIIATVSRPTLVKSIVVNFTGTYSICWTDGIGPSREEYFQYRQFHDERLMLTSANLVSSSDWVQDEVVDDRQLSSGWEQVSCDSSASSATNVGSTDGQDEPPSYPELDIASFQQTALNSFTLPAGTHRLEFVFMIPPRMPSTILSHLGGIEYKLSVFFKTKGNLGMPVTTRADVPVQLVNIPTRLAQLQSSLPVNDETMFTRQIDESWWILVKVSSCTTFPEDIIRVSTCLSWPSRCSYNESVGEYLELLAVQLDLCEITVHKSMLSGKPLKNDMITIATSMSGDQNLLNVPVTAPPSYESSQTALPDTKPDEVDDQQLAEAIHAEEVRAQEAEEASSRVRGMFNESRKQEFRIKVPKQRDMTSTAKKIDGIHIDCRSAPLSVGHQLHITLQIMDKVTKKLHLVPFHCRVVIIPEVESFLLPEYGSSLQDTRVQ